MLDATKTASDGRVHFSVQGDDGDLPYSAYDGGKTYGDERSLRDVVHDDNWLLLSEEE